MRLSEYLRRVDAARIAYEASKDNAAATGAMKQARERGRGMHSLTAMVLAIIGANGSYRPVRLVAVEWPKHDQEQEQAEKGAA